MTDAASPSSQTQDNGFFINNGTFSGNLTSPDGQKYDIRKLEPRKVTNPKDGVVSTIWGGYANARDIAVAAKDDALAAEFKKTGHRPAELFAPESREIPLYITLRERPGASGYSHIGSLWTAAGRYTILARDLEGKKGLRFGGNVLSWKSPEALAAEREAKDAQRPTAPAAKSAGTQPGGTN